MVASSGGLDERWRRVWCTSRARRSPHPPVRVSLRHHRCGCDLLPSARRADRRHPGRADTAARGPLKDAGRLGLVLVSLQRNWLTYVRVDEPQGCASSVPPLAVATSEVGEVRFHGRNASTWEARNASPSERFAYDYRTEAGRRVTGSTGHPSPLPGRAAEPSCRPLARLTCTFCAKPSAARLAHCAPAQLLLRTAFLPQRPFKASCRAVVRRSPGLQGRWSRDAGLATTLAGSSRADSALPAATVSQGTVVPGPRLHTMLCLRLAGPMANLRERVKGRMRPEGRQGQGSKGGTR